MKNRHLKKGRGENRKYDLVETYNTKEDVIESLISHDSLIKFKWSKRNSNVSASYVSLNYTCTSVRGAKCSAKVCIVIHSANQPVEVRLCDNHDHTTTYKEKGMPETIKQTIKELFNLRVARTATAIVRVLRERNIQQPTIRQINNFLSRYRKKSYSWNKFDSIF